MSGGKSDRFDAFVLSELARTDSHRFRVLESDADETKALRALTRAREDLVKTKVATGNQLRSELERFWPGPIGLFCDLVSPISLAFLESYPSPADARSLGEKRLAAFLARQRYSGRQQPAQLLAKLRRAPQGRVGEIELGARRQLVLCLVQMLKMLGAQIDTLERQIATLLLCLLLRSSWLTVEGGRGRRRHSAASPGRRDSCDRVRGRGCWRSVAAASGPVRRTPVFLGCKPPIRLLLGGQTSYVWSAGDTGFPPLATVLLRRPTPLVSRGSGNRTGVAWR